MAELTKAQVQAAADRAANLSLADDDIALQTADTMPERLSVKGTKVETAGTEVHGAITSYTRREVERALESWGEGRARRGRRPGTRSAGTRSAGARTRTPRSGDRRVGTGQQAVPSPDANQTTGGRAATGSDTGTGNAGTGK